MRESLNAWQVFLCFLTVIYLVVVTEVALFSREPGSRDAIDLQFLGTWGNDSQSHAYVIENIIMFIPFGILIPLTFAPLRKLYFILPTVFVGSAAIEITQLCTKRGYCQLDDVVMNVLGGMIGYGVLLLCSNWYYKLLKKQNINVNTNDLP